MAKDYAKRSRYSASRKQESARTSRSQIGLWILVILLIILFGGCLFYLKQYNAHLLANRPPVETATTSAKTESKKNPPPRFDFYTELPKTKTIAPQQQKVANTAYVLQLGVFKNRTAADQLRAKAIMQGFDTNVKSFKKGDNTFYSVWMGPYKTKAEAQQQQSSLATSQIKSQITKQD